MRNGAWAHLCIDMQDMFKQPTPWHVPWMARVADTVVEVSERFGERTVFTRFIPPQRPQDMWGVWRRYYEKWPMMTREHLDAGLLDLVPELRRLVPPARLFDKATYSPWFDGSLNWMLKGERIDSLVISGGETDVCVLVAALGAVDLGYRVVVLADAVCSGADATHDASLEVLGERFSAQVEICRTEAFLSSL